MASTACLEYWTEMLHGPLDQELTCRNNPSWNLIQTIYGRRGGKYWSSRSDRALIVLVGGVCAQIL
eukprot:3002001-Amphidinium_carterae.1